MQSQLSLLPNFCEQKRTTRGVTSIINENSLFQTEGIRYSGSKRTIIPFIHELIKELPIHSVLDGFSGSTRVSQFFKRAGYSVHANDLAIYSYVFGMTYIVNTLHFKRIEEKIAYLNQLPPQDGFFTEAYGGDDDGNGNVLSSDGKKKPFQRKNTQRIDSIRPQIDQISENEIEKNILLTSLILGLDKIENTLGHQVAYLAKWAGRSYECLILEMPRLLQGNQSYRVTQQDVASIRGSYDLAYFDPPYNTNNSVTLTTRVRYASYYHFWTTLIKNDRPELIGAANRRKDCSSDKIPGAISPYESTKISIVDKEFIRLLDGVNASYILLSYSNKGKMPVERIIEIMKKLGKLEIITIDHKENVQKVLTINKSWLGDQSKNIEYLFLLKKE
jgi:adenine-specific DNA-methyltransferase